MAFSELPDLHLINAPRQFCGILNLWNEIKITLMNFKVWFMFRYHLLLSLFLGLIRFYYFQFNSLGFHFGRATLIKNVQYCRPRSFYSKLFIITKCVKFRPSHNVVTVSGGTASRLKNYHLIILPILCEGLFCYRPLLFTLCSFLNKIVT